MAEFKQELPPPGGYAPITYQRVPLKKGISAIVKLGILVATSAAGTYFFLRAKERINNDRIEMRCAKIALRPMLEAEVDRMLLKQLKRNRDAEERIMKDVEGWEVGTWNGSRVFLSLGPDEYFKPDVSEYYAHTSESWFRKTFDVSSVD